MEIIRIGEKTISRWQIDALITKVLELRSQGLSQQEAAQKLSIDRTFISRLESIGEVRKGPDLAVVGFPVANRAELEDICRKYGVDWWLFFSEKERLDFVEQKSGLQLFNDVMDLLTRVRSFSTIVVLGSTSRIKIIEALLDTRVVGFPIGESPLTRDVVADTNQFEQVIRSLSAKGGPK
ncbi:MAG: helix-turn-helix domain-containing protein [Firmicutes bacterium]|nr:helix-turn-helix domain-containing protein [Bacillota bacterium]